jgi:hypothetical protein
MYAIFLDLRVSFGQAGGVLMGGRRACLLIVGSERNEGTELELLF